MDSSHPLASEALPWDPQTIDQASQAHPLQCSQVQQGDEEAPQAEATQAGDAACVGGDSCTCPERDVSTPPRAWDEFWDEVLPREAREAEAAEAAEAAARAAARATQSSAERCEPSSQSTLSSPRDVQEVYTSGTFTLQSILRGGGQGGTSDTIAMRCNRIIIVGERA